MPLTSVLGYDAADRVTSQTDAQGVNTKFVYDLLGRQTQQIEAFGTALARVTDFAYDRLGRLTNLVAHDGPQEQATSYSYDLVGRRRRIVYPDSTDPEADSVRFEYDEGGRMTRTTDQRGIVAAMTYDKRGFPRRREFGWQLSCSFKQQEVRNIQP